MNALTDPKIWLEDAIYKKYIRVFDYDSFRDIKHVSTTTLKDVKKAQIKCGKKVILEYLKDDVYEIEDKYYTSFVREVQNIMKLNNSENIIKFLGISKDPSLKFYCIVFQCAYGEDLRIYLKKKSTELSWPARVQMAKGVINGMRDVHRENIVHCNLNPKNILVYNDSPVIKGFDASISLDGFLETREE
ncbi:15500_t:CDS:2 [Acaulospora morrowiae]|uniref:15500_t:CDS:1 n=1 Tax=Acaulospora morrowiae TaxID=94023 RepID=A0A9N8ZNP0_9GLOM|nr:15500_t:CDS:2 [Acaulospora morrowiae]